MIGNNPYKVNEFLQMSLNNLKLDYIDLYLIHFPVGFVGDDYSDLFPKESSGKLKIDDANYPLSVWKVVAFLMIRSIDMQMRLKRQWRTRCTRGKRNPSDCQTSTATRSIALSSTPTCSRPTCKSRRTFTSNKVDCDRSAIKGTSQWPPTPRSDRPPESNAARNRPHNRKTNIQNTRFNCGTTNFLLLSELHHVNVLEDDQVKSIAECHSKTPAQILLRHLVQQGVAVIPGSTDRNQIIENFNVLVQSNLLNHFKVILS